MSERPQPVFRAAGTGRVAAVDSRQLECFIAVAEELNINRAAVRLHMTQPPLTRRIQRLEHDVGVGLFRRTPGGMELAEAGRSCWNVPTASSPCRPAPSSAPARRASGKWATLASATTTRRFSRYPRHVSEFRDRYPDMKVSFELVPNPRRPTTCETSCCTSGSDGTTRSSRT